MTCANSGRGGATTYGDGEQTQPLIVRLRQEIEVFALRSAFDRAAGKGLPRLQAILERLRTACEAGDAAGLAEHDMAFHRAIVEMPGDDDLVAVWLPIVVRMMLHYTRHGDLMESYREHAAILEAIRAGKKREAVQALEANTY